MYRGWYDGASRHERLNNRFNRVPREGTLVRQGWRYIRNFVIDEGVHATKDRPLEIGFQERVSNHHKLLGLRVPVVNIAGKSRLDLSGKYLEDERK